MMASSSGSPCAACKFLRRKCTSECVFSPYFPPDQPLKFANVHKIFGASNISKLLNELPPHQREDAVNSLAYEADARVKDPVYGCVGAISILQRQIAQLQQELGIAQSDLARAAHMNNAHHHQMGIPGHHVMGIPEMDQMMTREQWMEMGGGTAYESMMLVQGGFNTDNSNTAAEESKCDEGDSNNLVVRDV